MLAALAVTAAAVIVFGATGGGEEQKGPRGAPGIACDAVAEPGTAISALVDDLASAQTVCLREGVHRSSDDIVISARDVTLSSYPGERATLRGRLWIREGADGATVTDLLLDGRNPGDTPSPTVNANNARFHGNEVTNQHTAICFVLGDDEYGEASGTVIEDNEIHDCGQLPATNQDHGIYVAHAVETVIRNNWIYSNADRGVQLYPDADRTLVTGNVIDGNGQGVIFGGNGERTSDDNLVERNLITNSTIRWNVESSWPDDVVGTGNVVRRNCIFGGVRDDGDGSIQTPARGFDVSDNLIVDPLYVDRGAGDFELEPESPCADLLAGS